MGFVKYCSFLCVYFVQYTKRLEVQKWKNKKDISRTFSSFYCVHVVVFFWSSGIKDCIKFALTIGFRSYNV